MKFVEKLKLITDKFLLIVLVISGIFLGTSVLFYVLNCMMRYLFKAPLAWPEEYCTYIVVLMVFLMQCRLEFRDESLSIAVIWEKVKHKPVPRRVMFTVKMILTIIMSALLMYCGYNLTKQQMMYRSVLPVTRIPFSIYYGAITVCFILVIIVGIIHLFTKKFDEKGEEDIYA